jgi:hypothetical protein
MRRLLKRGNFTSTQDLKQKILNFIAYYNCTFAKPFQWKFEGFPDVGYAGGLFLPSWSSASGQKYLTSPPMW